MPYKTSATLTSKGQVTLPAALRKLWRLQPGDRISFSLEEDERVVLTRLRRRSILESRKELPALSLGRPLVQSDIDDAVAEAMARQELRTRKERRR